MPDVLEAPPAAAPAPAPSPAPDSPPSQIRVSELPSPVSPLKPAKPGSARDRMRQEMEKRFGGEQPPAPAPKVEEKTEAKTEESPPEVDPGQKPPATKVEAPPATSPNEQKKTSPWKLVEQFKERLAKAEQRALDLEKQVIPEGERTSTAQRLQAAEQRAKELEDEIRYVNYSKSEEYQTKYQKPYEQAWQRAMSELSEITLVDPGSQQPRAVTAQDLMELVNMPLGQAREVADKVFGAFSDDVMAHRKEIRHLFDTQSQAIEEAKKTGSTRDQQRKEQLQKIYGAVSQTVKQTWDKVNSQVLEDKTYGEFFKPKEGDKEWNDRIEAGFKLVDQAFGENPMDPRLKAEDRDAIIKRHAAVRNRAAGWGPLYHENTKLRAKVESLEKDLKQYKESAPAAGRVQSQVVTPIGTARDQMRAALQKIAH